MVCVLFLDFEVVGTRLKDCNEGDSHVELSAGECFYFTMRCIPVLLID